MSSVSLPRLAVIVLVCCVWLGQASEEPAEEAVDLRGVKPKRRKDIVVHKILSAQEAFTEYKQTCDAANPQISLDQCRHNFIIEQLKPMFEVGLFGSLNTWLNVADTVYKLSPRNVILQSGTAVWMHGCRDNHMTNDVDAWLAPAPPMGIEFTTDEDHPFIWRVLDSEDKEVNWNTPFEVTFNDMPFLHKVNDKLRPVKRTQPICGNLARVEYLRTGRVNLFLVEYDEHDKPGGTKNPRVQIGEGNFGYGPRMTYGDYHRDQIFELDLYTPFGALDGDYQWPWTETANYLKAHPTPLNQVPVIPVHVALVQKLKLYFDCIIHAGHDAVPHRVKRDGEDIALFFFKNFEKMAQDIDDMTCMCRKCGGDESCLSLCAVASVISTGAVVGSLPSKKSLLADYKRELQAHSEYAALSQAAQEKFMNIPDIAAPEVLSKEAKALLITQLTHLKDEVLPKWNEKSLIEKLIDSSILSHVIASLTQASLEQAVHTLEDDIAALELK